MKRLGWGLLAFSLTCTAVPSAFAADMPGAYGVPVLRAPSAIIAADWAGIYIGGNLGGGVSSGSYTLNNGTFAENYTYDPASFVGGGQIGLQAQWGHWVAGLEGSYTWTGFSQTAPSTIAAGNLATLDVKYLGALSGKLGWGEGPWLVYGKAGWAFARTHTFDVVGGTSVETFGWDNGYLLGLGLDYQFAPGWVAGLAFDYYNFTPSRTFTVAGAPGGISNGDMSFYTFTARVSYLFNWLR